MYSNYAMSEFPSEEAPGLSVFYAAYGSGWDDFAGADPRRRGLRVKRCGSPECSSTFFPTNPKHAACSA